MKILVTGATGFIGNYLITQLLKDKNITIIATSRDQQKAESFEWFKRVRYIPFDINSEKIDNNLYELFNKPDILIHLAWDDLENYNSIVHVEQTYVYHQKFIRNLVENGLKNISITGTCLEYGMVNGMLSEEMAIQPATTYAIGKDMLRKYIKLLSQALDFNFKWIRLFYMYGEGQAKNSLYSQLEDAIKTGKKEFNMSKGDQIRDFMSIQDVVENIIQISKQNDIDGIINCCSNQPISVRSFVESYLEEKNYSLQLHLGYYPYPTYEPMAFWGDNTKLKKIKGIK